MWKEQKLFCLEQMSKTGLVSGLNGFVKAAVKKNEQDFVNGEFFLEVS